MTARATHHATTIPAGTRIWVLTKAELKRLLAGRRFWLSLLAPFVLFVADQFAGMAVAVTTNALRDPMAAPKEPVWWLASLIVTGLFFGWWLSRDVDGPQASQYLFSKPVGRVQALVGSVLAHIVRYGIVVAFYAAAIAIFFLAAVYAGAPADAPTTVSNSIEGAPAHVWAFVLGLLEGFASLGFVIFLGGVWTATSPRSVIHPLTLVAAGLLLLPGAIFAIVGSDDPPFITAWFASGGLALWFALAVHCWRRGPVSVSERLPALRRSFVFVVMLAFGALLFWLLQLPPPPPLPENVSTTNLSGLSGLSCEQQMQALDESPCAGVAVMVEAVRRTDRNASKKWVPAIGKLWDESRNLPDSYNSEADIPELYRCLDRQADAQRQACTGMLTGHSFDPRYETIGYRPFSAGDIACIKEWLKTDFPRKDQCSNFVSTIEQFPDEGFTLVHAKNEDVLACLVNALNIVEECW